MRYLIVVIKFISWLFIVIFLNIFSKKVLDILFQNKHFKLKEDLKSEDEKNIQNGWQQFYSQNNILEEYKNDFFQVLEYFVQFDKTIIFDEEKNNPQYAGIQYMFYIISLAKEAIIHLNNVTKEEKRISYYENNQKASLDDLIQFYKQKLEAKNEHKLLTKIAKNEVRLKKYLVKLKKHDTLFTNFYLLLFTIFPIENHFTKEKEKEDLEIFQSLFNFFRVGHATKNQIYKSVAIQIYNLHKHNISNNKIPYKTTDERLKEEIGKLIDYVFQTEKSYKNFNDIEQEAYVKNVIYNFPLFECDISLSQKQIRRFKFYFIGKNALVPRYIPKFVRKIFLNKIIETPLSYYRNAVRLKLFGLFQRKI